MAINKVIYGGEVLLDLTGDTVTPDKLLSGTTTHDKSGTLIEGTCPFDVDSTDATVGVAEILLGQTAYARGAKITGTMPNNGGVTGVIATKDGQYIIPQGYHDGSGKVSIELTEQEKLIATNIREGITILGITGTMSGLESVKSQVKTATPSTVAQSILPDEGFNYLSQVDVAPIPYVESENTAGGTTVTIG